MIRVTVWNEYEHERTIPAIANVYPEGIHGAIKAILSTEEDMEVRCSTLQDPEQGLSEEILQIPMYLSGGLTQNRTISYLKIQIV
jgi:trehalose utilization protein